MTRLSVRYYSDRIEVIDSDGFFGPSWMTIGQEQLRGAKPGDKMTVIRHGKSITFDLVEPKDDPSERRSAREYYPQFNGESAEELYNHWEHGRHPLPGWRNMSEEEKWKTVRQLRPARSRGSRGRRSRE